MTSSVKILPLPSVPEVPCPHVLCVSLGEAEGRPALLSCKPGCRVYGRGVLAGDYPQPGTPEEGSF